MNKPVSLITGISGQDGSYLAEYLLALGYEVHGLVRSKQFSFPVSYDQECVTENLMKNVHFHQIDLCNPENLTEIISEIKPEEVYHLAAQSHVGLSFQQPVYTAQVTGLGTLHLLEAIRKSGLIPYTKFYNACSSEIFGDTQEKFQNENSDMFPVSPYACAKMFSYDLIDCYVEAYGMYAINGICFNHESPRRHKHFVTRKITLAIANFLKNGVGGVIMGNLDARRDWGYAPEYIMAMHTMLQFSNHGENSFVLGTGTTVSVRDFMGYACKYANVDPCDVFDLEHCNNDRPQDVNYLCADSSLAYGTFGWQPKVLVPDLVEIMVDADLKMLGVK